MALFASLALSGLPSLRYAFTSFTTAVPSEAAEFCATYFGATVLSHEKYIAHNNVSAQANVSAVRFPYSTTDGTRTFHDVYFVHDPSKRSGNLTTKDYMQHLHGVHRFDVEETWDWFQDWHLCLATPDIDLVLARLMRDGRSFVTRSSYSFYVEVPYGITFQVLGTSLKLAWSEPFNFCRYTAFPPQLLPEQVLKLAPLPEPLPPLPELPPAHHSFFSTRPTEALNFTLRHLGADPYNMSHVWRDSHRYSDGRCALLAWAQLPGYQLHFVQQQRKTQGPDLRVAQLERYFVQLHRGMTAQDAFFDNRVGFWVDDLSPFEDSLRADGLPFLTELQADGRRALYLQLPGGIIVQLLEDSASVESLM